MSVLAVPLRGKLERHSLAVVLRDLLRNRRDGCLNVWRGAVSRRIYLRGGMIIYGSSTERQDRLGEILIAQGKLSRGDQKKYWEQSQTSNQLLGITLVLNGRITQSDLYQGITAQVVTILDRLQKWRKGDYEFEVGCEPSAGTVLLCIPLSLYLRADSEKKPRARKALAGESAADKAAAAKPAAGAVKKKKSAAPAPSAEPPDSPGVVVKDELEFEIPGKALETDVVLSPEGTQELDLIGEISFMVQELRKRVGQDPLTLLGVPAGSDRQVVQAAFYRIAKLIHPDRLPKGCSPDLISEAEEIFREVIAASQEAEEGLRLESTSQSAAAPSSAGGAHGGGVPVFESDPARRFFAKGRDWISKRNYWQAVDALRQAVRIKPDDALYRKYLGLSLMQTKRMHEAEEHLKEAARLEPNNPTHLVNLGRVYRAGRLFRKAREAFERALRIDSRNEHARDELSDLPEDIPPAKKTETGGIFRKFFGKG